MHTVLVTYQRQNNLEEYVIHSPYDTRTKLPKAGWNNATFVTHLSMDITREVATGEIQKQVLIVAITEAELNQTEVGNIMQGAFARILQSGIIPISTDADPSDY